MEPKEPSSPKRSMRSQGPQLPDDLLMRIIKLLDTKTKLQMPLVSRQCRKVMDRPVPVLSRQDSIQSSHNLPQVTHGCALFAGLVSETCGVTCASATLMRAVCTWCISWQPG